MDKATYEKQSISDTQTPFIFHIDPVHRHEHVYVHWHENIEFLCCFEGEGEVMVDTNAITMKSGDTVVINTRRIHSVATQNFVNYYCLIVDNLFFTENGIDVDTITFTEPFCDKKASALMKKIHMAYKNKNDEFSVTEIRNAVLSYILYMCKNYSSKKDAVSTRDSKSYKAILDAVEYINANFTEKLTLDEIAEQIGYSKYHFTRLFKEFTGFTVIEHINAKRCENAAYLLLKTDKPISDICYESGFEYSTYFAKTFKKLYGRLPSEYRKLYAKQ